jgi:hypothetical protein
MRKKSPARVHPNPATEGMSPREIAVARRTYHSREIKQKPEKPTSGPTPVTMKKDSSFKLRSGNNPSVARLSGVESPMQKRKRKVEYTQDPETGDITKKITRKSGATVTKTFKEGERRASKIVRDNKRRTRTVTGKGLDKEIDVRYKTGKTNPDGSPRYYRYGNYSYKTTPRQNIKEFKEGVGHVIGGGATIAALASVAPGLLATKTKALLGKATVAGIKAGVGGFGALAISNAADSIKKKVKNIKQNIRSKRQKRRESKIKKA